MSSGTARSSPSSSAGPSGCSGSTTGAGTRSASASRSSWTLGPFTSWASSPAAPPTTSRTTSRPSRRPTSCSDAPRWTGAPSSSAATILRCVAGPPVVERLGQKLTKNQLGGWEIQLKAGAVDDAVDTEEEAFARVRRFLSYLPSSIDKLPARGPRIDEPERREPWLFEAIPHDVRKPYKMRAIVEAVVDTGSFFEIAPLYGRPIITGLARLDGWPVPLMASDPFFYGGAWTAYSSQKVERFVDLAQTSHPPSVNPFD